ncbi:MAG: GerMN domain-containing protein [Patescibacteria group bacterium]
MSKILKSFLYIAICAFAFVIIMKAYSSSFASKTATVFEWEKEVSIYLSNSKMGSSDDCTLVFSVTRKILNAETFGPGALEALLKGPTLEDKENGYTTSINDNVLIQRFEILDNVAYVDFNSRFNERMGGSCRVQAIKSQIENTLNALSDIDSVVISVNGETEGILEP